MLCSTCNLALGLLKEDPSRIATLLEYAQLQQEEADKPGPFPKQSKPKSPPIQDRRPRNLYYRIYCDDLYGSRVVTIRDKDESRFDPMGFVNATRYASPELAAEALRGITFAVDHPSTISRVERFKAAAWLIDSGNRYQEPSPLASRN